jgi:NADH-quinone oxidoreductase subunit N
MTQDVTVQAGSLLALLPEIVLSVAALAVLLLDVFQRGEAGGPSAPGVPRLAVGGVVAAAAANLALVGIPDPGASSLVAVDGLRVASNFLLLTGAGLGLLFAGDWLDREDLRIGEFYALVLFATVGAMVLAGARDLILTFLGLEMMSISVYVLTAFNRRDPRSSEAGLKYFLIGAFASAFLIYGVALLYGATGTTQLAELAARIGPATGEGSLLVWGGVGFLLVGFGFKVSAVPFHMWAPDAYQGAPTPVTGYMAAAVKAAAFLALLRVVTHLEAARAIWESALWWLAMLTMIVPNLIALAQDDVKRMLAYSSVAHAGYVLVGLVSGGTGGVSASIFYLGVYTLMTLGAFGFVYLVAGRGDRRSGLGDFRGLGWRRPWLGGAMTLFLLSLAGFPPTGGFVGKLFLLRGALDAGHVVLAVTLVLTSFVAYYYYLRVVWKMYFEESPEGALAPPAPGRSFRAAAAVCALGVLCAGLVPGPAIRATDGVAAGMTPDPAPRAAETAAPPTDRSGPEPADVASVEPDA